MIVVHDFVMLGKTVPEERRSDGRTFVCSAGYQPDLGLVRIYPLARPAAPARWTANTVRLQRNPKDSRRESWQLAGDRTPEVHDFVNSECFVQTGAIRPDDRHTLVPARYYVDSIAEANSQRRSLALLRPRSVDVVWTRPDVTQPIDVHQLELLAMESPGGKLDRIPRVRFDDGVGSHLLQLRDWGIYELIRKRGPQYAGEHAATALHLTDSSSLLIGNLNGHRTSWLVISVLNLGAEQQSLFSDQVAS